MGRNAVVRAKAGSKTAGFVRCQPRSRQEVSDGGNWGGTHISSCEGRAVTPQILMKQGDVTKRREAGAAGNEVCRGRFPKDGGGPQKARLNDRTASAVEVSGGANRINACVCHGNAAGRTPPRSRNQRRAARSLTRRLMALNSGASADSSHSKSTPSMVVSAMPAAVMRRSAISPSIATRQETASTGTNT